jgi:4-carboxymuconolactone decarboxylase
MIIGKLEEEPVSAGTGLVRYPRFASAALLAFLPVADDAQGLPPLDKATGADAGFLSPPCTPQQTTRTFSMSRLPYPDPATLSPEKSEVLTGSSGRVLNVSRMLMHAPDPLWSAQRKLGRATVYEATLDERLREILILRVAYLSNSEYELFHHLKIAENLGVTLEERESLRTGDFAALGPQERALAAFVTEVVRDVSPSDATLQALREVFPIPQIFEIVILIGGYMTTARIAAVGGVDLDGTAVEGWHKQPARAD